jgi:DNA-binding SARP family transcriptional activator
MLMYPNQVVHTHRLTEALWGSDLSVNGAGALRTHIWSMRRLLALAGRLQSAAGGYVLATKPGELDSENFHRMTGQAADAHDRGDDRSAALVLMQALALWREPELADVPRTPALQGAVRKLVEQRRAAHEAMVSIRLSLGQHRELLPELGAEVSAHPENEWYWELLMLGLYRCGRRAEALDAYRRVRAILVADYGIDPGPGLRRLQQQILVDDPVLSCSVSLVQPSHRVPIE